jgi:hypothetical protein
MFREPKKPDSPVREKAQAATTPALLPNDLIVLDPEIINNLAWP